MQGGRTKGCRSDGDERRGWPCRPRRPDLSPSDRFAANSSQQVWWTQDMLIESQWDRRREESVSGRELGQLQSQVYQSRWGLK